MEEPAICHYELRFESPLACPIDAFLGEFQRQNKYKSWNIRRKIVAEVTGGAL